MNNSAIPSRLTVVFSASGDKNTIPVNSTSETLADGLAAMDSGFPPLTRIALSAGGKPPKGQDFNGIFNDVYTRLQWGMAGAGFPFDSAFSSAISGYPKGARVPSSTFDGEWLNTVDGNNVNPENSTGTITGWVPVFSYGLTTISLSSSNVTLSSLQASRKRIVLTGNISSNLYLTFPAWLRKWEVINNCTGNYSVICRIQGSSGVPVPTGTTAYLNSDGNDLSVGNPVMVTAATKADHAVNMGQFKAQLNRPGYLKIPCAQSPSGYLIIQWGLCGTTGGVGSSDFAIPFPTAILNVQLQESNSDQWSTSTFTIWGVNSTGTNLNGIAIKGFTWTGTNFIGATGAAQYLAIGY